MFPKLFHPDHPHNEHPEPKMRKTLTPCHEEEMRRLLQMGWQIAPDDFLKAKE